MDQNQSVEFEEWHEAFQPFITELAEAAAKRPSRIETASIYSWPNIAGLPAELKAMLEHTSLSPIRREIGRSG